MEPLGIVFTELGPDFVRATMPVDARTRQPYGLLHGGASVLLAETLGSSAGGLCAPEGKGVVGIEINANHVRACAKGSLPAPRGRCTSAPARRCGRFASRTKRDDWCASRGSPWR
jgi:uncharacterized protein (TIGR00369 family)